VEDRMVDAALWQGTRKWAAHQVAAVMGCTMVGCGSWEVGCGL
jgi:hypothetical protein